MKQLTLFPRELTPREVQHRMRMLQHLSTSVQAPGPSPKRAALGRQ